MTLALVVALAGIALRFALDFEHIPNLVPIESVKNKYFDYIIIGAGTSVNLHNPQKRSRVTHTKLFTFAGTAGSVLSYELSKHSNYSVLLIEAGGIFNGLSSVVPIMSTLMQGTGMDWSFKSVPQKYSSRGLSDAQQSIPRGKGLGGSHQLNYLLHFNGLRSDFDEWVRLGADGWSYDNLKCFLDRHETAVNECQSGDNDMPKLSITSIRRDDSKLADAFVRAENEMRNVTINLGRFTTKRGLRHSVFHEYLRRAYKHRNLSIMVHAKVSKIEFDANKDAVSVVVGTAQQKTSRVHARREIILSAGSIHSPHILKLSGIGDEGELASVGINLLHQSSGVGENLFDHMNFPLFVSINETASVTKTKILSAGEIYRYLIDGSGVLSTTAVVGTARSADYGMILFGMGSSDEQALKHVANYETEAFRAFFPLHLNASQEGCTVLCTCLLPKSRGTVKIDPSNINGNPLIDPEYLKDDYDLLCIRNAVRMTIKMISTEAFRRLDAKIHWPRLKACENFGPFDEDVSFVPSDRYLDCLIRQGGLTGHHPGGTCSIGSVVDSKLR